MKDILLSLSATLVGLIVLTIFLPWWIVKILIGIAIALGIYVWVTKKIKLDSLWTKRIVGMALGILLLSVFISFVNQKWPWLGKATESREIYSSFKVTDWVDPKYPKTLAMTLYRIRTKLIEMEEIEQTKRMDEIYKKIEAGGKPDQSDYQAIKTAEKRFSELDKESATIRLSRLNGKAWLESVKTKTLPPKIFWFGLILLMAGLILKLATKKQYGRTMIGFGISILFIALAMTLFQPEIKASTKAIATKPQLQTRVERHLSGTFKLPADRKIIDHDISGRELSYRTGERIQLQQLNSPLEKLTFVNHNIPSWTRRQRIYTSGPATEDGKVELMSPEGKAITVQVRIIPRRS